jgi:hypothetical protein
MLVLLISNSELLIFWYRVTYPDGSELAMACEVSRLLIKMQRNRKTASSISSEE